MTSNGGGARREAGEGKQVNGISDHSVQPTQSFTAGGCGGWETHNIQRSKECTPK